MFDTGGFKLFNNDIESRSSYLSTEYIGLELLQTQCESFRTPSYIHSKYEGCTFTAFHIQNSNQISLKISIFVYLILISLSLPVLVHRKI